MAQGHAITFGVRDLAAPQTGPAGARYATVAEAARSAQRQRGGCRHAVADALAAAANLAGKVLIDNARLLEPMAMLWIHMALNRDQPTSGTFAHTERP